MAQLGWSCFQREEYRQTTKYYEKVFAMRGNNPGYYYHLAAAAWAALGEKKTAFMYLKAAVEHGWKSAEATRKMKEFAGLHEDVVFDEVLRNIENQS